MSVLRRALAAYRSAFAGLPREVWLLAAATLVNRAGTMVLPFLALWLTRERGLTTAHAGALLSLYGVGSLGGALLGGWLADRVGAVRVQILSLLGTGAGFLLLGHLQGAAAIAVALLALALIAETFRPALMAAVAERAPVAVRTRSLALVRLAINLGMSVGPAAGGLLAARHYTWLFTADALTCWAAAALLAVALPPGAAAGAGSRPPAPAASPWRDGPFVAFVLLMVGLGTVFFQLTGTFPLYLREAYGFREPTIGALLAANAIVVVLTEMVLLRAIEHLDRARVAAVGSLLVCAGFAMLPLGRGVGFALLSVLVWTAGEMLSLPMTNAIAGHRAPPGAGGRYMGAYFLAFGGAFVLAPSLGTSVWARWGPDAVWLAAGIAGVFLAAGFLALAPALRRAPPA